MPVAPVGGEVTAPPASPPEPPAKKYMPQLDGLRAVAIFVVMAAHYCPMSWVPVLEPWGPQGVRLFFVLSGFLITAILLRARDRMEAGGQSLASVVKWFVARRTLRIFPVFYAVLFTVAAGNISGVRDGFWWHVTYASNFFFGLRGDWHGRSSHFWSLAVEEQFYLVWPLLILCVPRAWHLALIAGGVALGPLSRIAGTLAGWNEVTVSVLPWGCCDTLGAGALLAWCWHEGHNRRAWWPRVTASAAWLCAPALVALLAYRTAAGPTAATVAWIDAASAGAYLVLVDAAARGMNNRLGSFLSHPAARWFGRISYSMYVVHNFLPHVLKAVFLKTGLPWATPVSSPVQTLWLFAASIPAALVLWYLVERPMNAVKDRVRFPIGKEGV